MRQNRIFIETIENILCHEVIFKYFYKDQNGNIRQNVIKQETIFAPIRPVEAVILPTSMDIKCKITEVYRAHLPDSPNRIKMREKSNRGHDFNRWHCRGNRHDHWFQRHPTHKDFHWKRPNYQLWQLPKSFKRLKIRFHRHQSH